MSMMNRRALTLIAGLGSVLLGACSGVGDGNSLESLAIAANGDTTVTYDSLKAGEVADIKSYQCFTSSLVLYGLFTKDGSVGSFTDRATWTSADPNIVKVSNADIAVPGQAEGTFYVRGTLIPVNPGSTTVTAKYLDLTASIPVMVAAPTEVTMQPSNPRIGINTVQPFRVTAKLDGVLQDVTTAALPTVAFSPVNDAVATSGLSNAAPYVTGLATGGPLTLNVTLPVCGQVLSTAVTVAPITSLNLQYEADFATDGTLVVGTNQALKTMADFGDGGAQQDVTAASTYAVDVSTDATATSRISATSNYVTAIAAGSFANVTAKCCQLDRNADGDVLDDGEAALFTSAALPITPVTGTLTSYAVAPDNGSGEQYTNQQFTATGTFDGSRTQLITRFVSWSVTDPSTATATTPALASTQFTIGNGSFSSTAGLGVSPLTGARLTEAKPLTVTATLLSALQPTTNLPAVTTTFTLTPLTTPAP